MRDVSHKTDTLRIAKAQATLIASPWLIQQIRDKQVPKGDVLEISRVAAIQAAKNTSQIIPFCHQVPLDWVGVEYELSEDRVTVTVTTKSIYKTGVEMEALTAASVAALNIYDLLKPYGEEMQIANVELLQKIGGKSDLAKDVPSGLKAGVLIVSDSVSAGTNVDTSGETLRSKLLELGLDVSKFDCLPDEPAQVRDWFTRCSEERLDLLISTGGTGVSPRDHTPESIVELLDKRLPGVEEAIRSYGQRRLPQAMFSRQVVGTLNESLVICLPGSTGAVTDALNAIFPTVLHAIGALRGEAHALRR